MRRNSGKRPHVEENDENIVPDMDPTRPPLSTITAAVVNTASAGSDVIPGRKKVERTPSRKRQFKGQESAVQRTPEKIGLLMKNRFGWGGPKNDCESSGSENCDEVAELPPLGRGGNCFGFGTPRKGRSVGKGTSDGGSVEGTPTKSVPRVGSTGLGWSRAGAGVAARTGSFSLAARRLPIASSPSTVVNSVEVPHFELIENPVFWMQHNVQVVIRVRPLNVTEISLQGYKRCLKQEDSHRISWIGQPEARFVFDQVACETINQESLFRVVGQPMVENCMSGYNSCIFAYGQTGSGKTYTMLGDLDNLELRPSHDRGIIPRMFEFLFARIRVEEESRKDEKLKYNCKCSFLEIYNEQITDLLDPSSTNLILREDAQKAIYVENLTEFVVENTKDIVKLIAQGAANRRMAATNMNRESSRSHGVFTCVIESTWEKDSVTNLRFARLNLVDLAGSERQKMSGAEGERLKEAANINKSLSTLGHVIMVLVDMAHGKLRHVPYRDSRLTFLLQDSLGGNSKTMIIANVSPSVSCSSETLSTLRFAQRAKFIQNNAFVNEDASGDVIALQRQIRLLKEEVSMLRHQNVSRSISFQTKALNDFDAKTCETSDVAELPEDNDKLKSLEGALVGALRREKAAEITIKQLEAENQKLNQLVHQRDDEIQCTKMMLKFREDKVQRMEALVNGLVSGDSYTLEESSSLAKEVKLLQDRADKNPEVTRFALENIRLLEKIRRLQDFYQEGERELLLSEVSNLRDQLVQVLERKTQLDIHSTRKKGHLVDTLGSSGYSSTEKDCLRIELKKTHEELEDCRNNLKSYLEINERLIREMDDIRSQMNITKPDCNNLFVPGETVDMELFSQFSAQGTMNREKIMDTKDEITMQFAEKVVDLQLELDILKLILGEVKLYHSDAEDEALDVSKNLAIAEEKVSLLNKNNEDAKMTLKAAEAVIEALESKQVLSINEIEELRTKYDASEHLLMKQDMEINFLRSKLGVQTICQIEPSECDPPMEMKLNKLQASLDKARFLTLRYQSDHNAKILHEQEMDEIREQVEAETAEVIVCLQEEIHTLQKQLCDSKISEMEARESLVVVETEFKIAQERLCLLSQDNEQFMELLEEKDRERRSLTEEWETFARGIGDVLSLVNIELEAASFQIDSNINGLPYKAWISEHISTIVGSMSEKDSLVEELQKSLVDAQNIRCDLEWKLRSLQEATLAITEEQQKKNIDKDREIFQLSSQLSDKESVISELEGSIKQIEDQMKKAELHATVAFLTVSRISDINSVHLEELKDKRLQVIELEGINLQKDSFVQEQISLSANSDELIQLLRSQLIDSERNVVELKAKLDEKQEHIFGMQSHLEKVKKDLDAMKCSSDLLEVGKKLNEFNLEMNTLQTCMNEYKSDERNFLGEQLPGTHAVHSANNVPVDQTKGDPCKCISEGDCNNSLSISATGESNTSNWCSQKDYFCGKHELMISEGVKDVKTSILLLWKEIQFAFQCLGGLQAQMSRILDEEMEIKQCNVHSKMKIEDLTVEVRKIEMEMIRKEEIFESQLSELCHKMKILEGKVEEYAKDLDRAKTDFMLDINVASRHAAEKDFEASILLSQFEEALGKINQYDIQRQMCIKDLMATVHSIEVEMIHKESSLESRLKDLHHEMQLLKGKTEDSIKVLNENKTDMMIEIGESTRLAAEKDFEALVLLSHFKETQGVIAEANAIFNSFMLINESAKLEVQNHLKTEKVLIDERDKLREEVCGLDSMLEMAKLEYDLLEKKFQSNMIDLEVIVTSVQSMLTQVQTSFMQELESLSYYIDTLKSEFFHLISMERISLENLLTEIIGKNCAVSVLLLCQNGMFLEKIAVLTDNARSCHCRLRDLNAHVSDLSEQPKNEKEAAEMCVLKGRLLVDINNDLNYIAINESKAADLKPTLCIIEEKLLESDKEDLLLARFVALTNELGVVMKELDDNDSNTMYKLFSEDPDKLALSLAVRGRNGDLKQKTLQMAQFKSQIEALDGSIENMQSEKLLSLFEGELAKQMLMELEIEVSILSQQINDAHMQLDLSSYDSHRLMQELMKRNEEKLLMEMKLKKLELDFHDRVIKELELSDHIKFQQTAINEKVQEFDDLIDRFSFLTGENSTLSNDLKEASDKNARLSMKIHLLENENVKISGEHLAMKAHLEDIVLLKNLELEEKDDQIRRLEKDIIEMKILLDQQTNILSTVQNDLDILREERNHFDSEIFIMKEHLEMANKLAEENEAIALEAQQIAESRKVIVEEKEEEVKLLEKSIEELECTINVLQNKVEIVKDEAERQQLQREELEIEVLAVKHQLLEVKRRDIENNLDGVPGHCKVQGNEPKKVEIKVQLLENDIKDRNEEISRCQQHILELNVHAEAQAQQNAQKIMELETMLDKLKSEPLNGLGSTASRCERNAVKTRGSSSPFKCIGLGFTQVNSYKEEELTCGRLRIQELESLSANQRKEIFSLNTRLVASESMTHDVIRDLLGVKLDIAKYASLVDHQQLQKIMESPCLQHEDSLDKVMKEHETIKLKKQLNEFIEERQGWLDELNRRHSEMVATKISLEKLWQHDQFLTTENEVLKADNMRHKKMVMQFEDEIKKLHSQQNLQYRINHHARIKEENNILKIQKQDIATKLQKSEEVLSCVRAELAAYQSSTGTILYDDTDEEQRFQDELPYSEK